MLLVMNIFKLLYKSIYSPKDIARFRHESVGKAVLYIFLLSLIAILPISVYLSLSFVQTVKIAKEEVAEQLPPFSIENGILKSELNAPLEIDLGDALFIFDSTGETTLNDLDLSINQIAFLKEEMVLTSFGTYNQYAYSMFGELTITGEELTHFINGIYSMLNIIIPIFAIMLFLFTAIGKFIQVFILSFIGKLFSNRANLSLLYKDLWKISACSITLITMFFTIMDALNTQVPFSFSINWIVSIIVLYLAIKEVPKTEKIEK